MSVAQEIYNDPRLSDITKAELAELLADCIMKILPLPEWQHSNNDVSDGLFVALEALVKTSEQEATVREMVEFFFDDPGEYEDDEGEEDDE
jgi:hypothetical protein